MTSAHTKALLALTLVPGLGPVRISRLLHRYQTPERILGLTSAELAQARGIGPTTADAIVRGIAAATSLVDPELDRAGMAGVQLIGLDDTEYPPLLAEIPNAPPVLYVRGQLAPNSAHAYTAAIVGSRNATHYGIEQAGRFGGALARAGLTVVSGGARGIDTAAHRGALQHASGAGCTIAVLGCGVDVVYPPENAALFASIVEAGGAVVSELPMGSAPTADNFPARNRIISGLSLGVLVVEAGARSGALITARQAVEEHGREVMALPGRIDSAASAGTNALIRDGAAALVTDPGDVLAQLEAPARHAFDGTHAVRYQGLQHCETISFRHVPGDASDQGETPPAVTPNGTANEVAEGNGAMQPHGTLDPLVTDTDTSLDGDARRVLLALVRPMTADELCEVSGLPAGRVRSAVTMLEVVGRIRRSGARLERRTP